MAAKPDNLLYGALTLSVPEEDKRHAADLPTVPAELPVLSGTTV